MPGPSQAEHLSEADLLGSENGYLDLSWYFGFGYGDFWCGLGLFV